ncbi:hypothetical protein BDV96DRAFT_592534 [Lophiotrema nucula]|uniref:F-box domain-containing protein n=1 Tax=Lophiotrema nucula TaxID=690887 RepID=A0A6A5YGW6_9PLEO|nr:hypothetical protein BDV96DRAFT_592534 [Lophiotrema nucula]
MFGAPSHGLGSLPNELLFEVLHDLPNDALCQLSLVSKKICRVAQEVLHRSPELSVSQYWEEEKGTWMEDGRLANLLRTFINRPDLAKVVQRLTLSPIDRSVRDRSSMMRDIPPETAAVLGSSRINVTEPAIVGMILQIVPNLQELSLQATILDKSSYKHRYDEKKYTPDLISDMFGDDTLVKWKDYFYDFESAQIAGLAGLKKLRLATGELHWSWCELPKLEVLHVDRVCRVELYDVPTTKTSDSILELILERDTNFLFEGYESNQIRNLLSKFTSLTTLTLRISNYLVYCPYHHPSSRKEAFGFGSFLGGIAEEEQCDEFLSHLLDTAQTLRHLEILVAEDEHEDGSFLQLLAPVASFQLPRLTHLKVPSEMLIRCNSDYITKTEGVAKRLLPSTLTRLEITYPWMTTADLLADLSRDRDLFAALEEVVIHGSSVRGNANEQLFEQQPFWSELEGNGINVAWKD